MLALATWTLFAACVSPASTTALPPSDIPTIAASDLGAAATPLLLPRHLPGYDLRVLDHRKSVPVETAAAGRVQVQLPIYVYVPAPEREDALRQLREAADDLRRAAHVPDRASVDLDGLLSRFERALAQLGQP